jgi:hypothetical protein
MNAMMSMSENVEYTTGLDVVIEVAFAAALADGDADAEAAAEGEELGDGEGHGVPGAALAEAGNGVATAEAVPHDDGAPPVVVPVVSRAPAPTARTNQTKYVTMGAKIVSMNRIVRRSPDRYLAAGAANRLATSREIGLSTASAA